jgi:Flp pilus assembly protein TadD
VTISSILRYRISLAALALVLAALLLWNVGKRNIARRANAPSEDTGAAAPTDPTAWQAALAQGYEPSRHPCAACHAEITAQYAHSGMSRSWRVVTRAIATALPSGLVAVVPQADFRYELWQREGGIWQVEKHREDPHQVARQAACVIGSGTHAVALAWEERGYWFQLPLAWFRQDNAWRLSPGYEQKNHRFDRPITAACVGCHRGQAEADAAAPNWFAAPVEAGIDCAACHGPTDKHVAAQRAAARGEGTVAAEAHLVHPGRLAPLQANSLCLRCHLQGDVTVYRPGCDPLHFVPGQDLRDWRHDLVLEGSSLPSVASHGADMLASRCYVASGGRMTCVSCHDAHRPARARTTGEYDARCASCHRPQDCRRVPGVPPSERNGDSLLGGNDDSSASCIGCHMPRRPTREGLHAALTDHTIPRRGSVEPPAASSPVGHSDALVSAWPEKAISAATLGAAYVLLHETMGPRPKALQQALTQLEQALRQDPEDRESHFWLGSALVALGQGQAARPHFEAALARQPEWPLARFRLGLAWELAGDRRAAIEAYEQLLRDAPRWIEPYDRLADLYLAENRPDRAAEVLQRRLAHLPQAAALATWAMAVRLRGGAPAQAMAAVDEALRLDPREPRVYLVRASLWLLAGQDELARADLEHALELQPDHPSASESLRRLNRRP